MPLATSHASSTFSLPPRSAALATLALVGFADTLRAEVRVVPTPGLYASIQQAVDVSQNGDVIVVQAGSYTGFTVDGLGIAVENAPDAFVLVTSTVTLRDLPSGERAVLRGLQQASPVAGSGPGLVVEDCAGEVRVEACVWRGAHALLGSYQPFALAGPGAPGARVESCASIVFSACEFVGGEGALLEDEDQHPNASDGGHALRALDSNVALYASTLRGGAGGSVYDTTTKPGGDGGSGLSAQASTVFASSSTFVGADGGFADCDFFLGICGTHGNGGHGARLDASSGSWRACAFGGGFGGTGPDAGLPGLPIEAAPNAFPQLPGPSLRHFMSSPVVSGELATLRFAAPAGHAALIAIATGPAPSALPLPAAGPTWIQLAGVHVRFLGFVSATGNASFHLATPGGASALPAGTMLHAQGVLLNPSTGAIHLADPSHVTLIDRAP